MKVLIIGGGGREHALAWKIVQSTRVERVWVAPGNAGTAREPGVANADVAATDLEGLVAFASDNGIDLTIVGPEAPLVSGVVDRFRGAGLAVFGPTQAAARLEGSKAFSKDFLARHHIPTAQYRSFTDLDEALGYLHQQGTPIVIKADGLAAGKGVVVATTTAEAEAAVRDMLFGNVFGDAGARVVIEEYLEGEEASFIVMADGEHVLPLATSQDHKRAQDGDQGPNTGGMGAYSPAPVVSEAVHQRIMDEVIRPTIAGMASEGCPYTGFLYAGLMITPEGAPKVIEFNCRFGDPEAEPILMRLRSDLAEHCLAALESRLDEQQCQWDERAAVGVVLAAGGYPGSYRKGVPIHGLDGCEASGCRVFHAGTAESEAGGVVSSGGRVLCVTALGQDVQAARNRAYDGLNAIRMEDGYYRRDIAHRALNRG